MSEGSEANRDAAKQALDIARRVSLVVPAAPAGLCSWISELIACFDARCYVYTLSVLLLIYHNAKPATPLWSMYSLCARTFGNMDIHCYRPPMDDYLH